MSSLCSTHDSHHTFKYYTEYTSILEKYQWIFKESSTLIKSSVPIMLTIFLEYSIMWISSIFTGHLPIKNAPLAYSCVGLGSSFFCISGMATSDGLCSAADTLSSQAYGYKNYKRVGIILQQGILISGLALFPIWALWFNTESILLLIQQPPCVAKFTATYMLVFSLSLPFTFLYALLRQYLMSQGVVWELVWIGLLSNCACMLLHYIFIIILDLGFFGSMLAFTLSNILLLVFLLIYIKFWREDMNTWDGWSYECLLNWDQFLCLALPGIMSCILNYLNMEFINIFAGSMGEKQLATSVVIIDTVTFLSLFSYGISKAVSIQMGHKLGSGNFVGAQRSAIVAIMIACLISVVYSIILLHTKKSLALLYIAGGEDIAKSVAKVIPVAVVFIFFEQIYIIISGILNASGYQKLEAIAVMVFGYMIGFPIGVYLATTSKSIVGLWIGLIIGTSLQCVLASMALLHTDWKKLSKKVIDQIERDDYLHQKTKQLDLVATRRTTRLSSTSSEKVGGLNKTKELKKRNLAMCSYFYLIGLVLFAVGFISSWFKQLNTTCIL